MIRIKYKEIILSLLYMYILNPIKFRFLPDSQMTIFYGVLLCVILLNYRFILKIYVNSASNLYAIKNGLFLWIIMLLLTCITPIFTMTKDFSYLSNIIGAELTYLIKILFLILITAIWLKNENPISFLFMNLFTKSMCIYVIFSVLLICIPGFRGFWSGIIVDSEYNMMLSSKEQYITRYGLSGFSGFKFTFFCTLSIIFLLFFLCANIYKNKKERKLIYLQIIILLVGNMFYGRVGLLCSILCIIVTIIVQLIVKHKFSLFLSFTGILFLLVVGIVMLKGVNEQINTWYNWAFEFLINYFQKGEFETAASTHLFTEMYFLPSINTVLFGDGYYAANYNYTNTDVGFLRAIIYFGLFGTILIYAITIKGMVGIKKSKGWIGSTDVVASNILFYLLVFSLVFFEMKGEVYYILMVLSYMILIMDCTHVGSLLVFGEK